MLRPFDYYLDCSSIKTVLGTAALDQIWGGIARESDFVPAYPRSAEEGDALRVCLRKKLGVEKFGDINTGQTDRHGHVIKCGDAVRVKLHTGHQYIYWHGLVFYVPETARLEVYFITTENGIAIRLPFQSLASITALQFIEVIQNFYLTEASL